MRWDRLFADLEGQLDAAERVDFEAEVADRTRRELALIHMADRVAAAQGLTLSLTVAGVGDVTGAVMRTGQDWVLLTMTGGAEVVVVAAAILAVRDLPVAAIGAAQRADSKLGIGQILRAIARDRTPVAIRLIDGTRLDGTVDRVGADFIDLAEHPVGEPRRVRQPMRSRTIAFAGLASACPGGW